jgi:putative ABC transport system permease protein
MAYRDSRATRWKLALFSTSIVFGVAALVIIGSLKNNLNDSVKGQSKSLLGADLQIGARQEFSEDALNLTREIGGEQAREISFSTMMTVGENPQPRLVTIRGVESGFPFYGEVATTPVGKWSSIHSDSPDQGVLVEESFLISMQGKIGDRVKFGDQELAIIGTLDQAPPSSSGFSSMSPTVVVSYDVVKNSDLLSGKSLSSHRTYFKLPEVEDYRKMLKPYQPVIDAERLQTVTATQRSERIESTVNNLYLFLNLIGFSSLFLGGIGIAGAIHIHISERIPSVVTLRCLGCTSANAFAIYFIQGVCMGVLGTLLGLALGCGGIVLLGYFLQSLPNLIPFDITIAPVWYEVAKSACIGFMISICFALLPLLKLRNISPLAALQQDGMDSDNQTSQSKFKFSFDPLRWLIILALTGTAFLLAWLDNIGLGEEGSDKGLLAAAGYVGFLALTFGLLLGCGYLLRWLLRICVRKSWPFTVRQGISALYRPNNQTSIFMLSIGLGVFFLFTLMFMQNILLQWLSPDRLDGRPNIFMLDVPPEDAERAEQAVVQAGSKPLGAAAIIQLRLTDIKGVPVEDILKAQGDNESDEEGENIGNVEEGGVKKIPRWVLRRSFRSTFRSELSDTEKLIDGEWIGKYDASTSSGLIPISMEEKIAADLGVGLGDTITMEIEGFGEEVQLQITSLREVDWRSMDLNFFIVLPEGAVDDYVSFNILTAHSDSPEARAELQRVMFAGWPSVSVIDLSLILKTVQSVLNTAGKAIQVMSLFTLITGSIVLISALLSGRKVRTRETVLLRTLGASQGQIARILAIEYALLATLATVSGAGLAALASALLSQSLFDAEMYVFPWTLLFTAAAAVIIITVVLGMLLSRGIAKTPPMYALKSGS